MLNDNQIRVHKPVDSIDNRKCTIEEPTGSKQIISIYDESRGKVRCSFPVHQACIQVALHYIISRAPNATKRKASRIDLSWTLHTSCDLAHIFVLKPWVTSPVDIADLTPFLLSCLEPFDTSSMAEPPQNHTFSENLSNLPRQIFQEVFGNLYPSNNLTTQCNRLMAPLLWRETLSTKSLIPWLWDIDEEACRQKDTQTPDDPSEHWDWELLVRTLTQERVFEPDHPLQHAPHGLRNRRRIWGIVEEIMQTSEEEKYFSRFARVR
ncbi:hypothetical protein MMC14_006726 [Varicellaria rhodocarpa]|nr:hypothetical protein [Varicellaria rhodocarpa]